MLGINGYELIILVVLALVILGPERLPQYAQKLGEWVRKARGMAEDAKKQFKDETGTDFDDVDWRRYDPRQYDPRRIIREALAEDYDQARRAVNEVRDAARLESPQPGGASGSRSGSRAGTAAGSDSRSGTGPGHRSGTAASAGPQAGSTAAESAGTAGAAHRSDAADPREVFGAGPAAGSSSETRAASGALAAGMAGSAAAGKRSAEHIAVEPQHQETAAQPAPFDVDAT